MPPRSITHRLDVLHQPRVTLIHSDRAFVRRRQPAMPLVNKRLYLRIDHDENCEQDGAFKTKSHRSSRDGVNLHLMSE